MNIPATELNFENAVYYHNDQFPPSNIDYRRLVQPLSAASAALARYDQMLRNMHNSEILLAPLRRQEAVVSSRMEGTISTLDEVLRYEADQGDDNQRENYQYRTEAVEVFLYHRAMQKAQAIVMAITMVLPLPVAILQPSRRRGSSDGSTGGSTKRG